MSEDLTTLARVKAYLALANSNADTVLAERITAVSAVVLDYVNRPTFAVTAYADVYDGSGKDFMLLRQWPVLSVASVECCGTTIAPSPDTSRWPPASGYVLEAPGGAQQRLMLFGYAFPAQRAGVRVNYTAGYQTLAEPHTVPATPFQVTTTRTWLGDIAVTLANGAALTKVTGSPAALQYAVSAAGLYTFNSAQAAAGVLISYSSVPAGVDQAVVEAVAESYKRASRIGIVSQSVAGQETVTYSQKDLSSSIRLALNSFRRLAPV